MSCQVVGNQTNHHWDLSCYPTNAYGESTQISEPIFTTLQSFTGNFIAANDPLFNQNYNSMFNSEDSSSSVASTSSSNASSNTSTTVCMNANNNLKKRGRGKALTEDERIERDELASQNKAAKVQAKLHKKSKK